MATPTMKKKSAKSPSSSRSSSSRRPPRRDAIAILKADHRDVAQLFREFEKAGDGANARNRRLAAGMISALSTHAAIDEQLLYPCIRATIRDPDPAAL